MKKGYNFIILQLRIKQLCFVHYKNLSSFNILLEMSI